MSLRPSLGFGHTAIRIAQFWFIAKIRIICLAVHNYVLKCGQYEILVWTCPSPNWPACWKKNNHSSHTAIYTLITPSSNKDHHHRGVCACVQCVSARACVCDVRVRCPALPLSWNVCISARACVLAHVRVCVYAVCVCVCVCVRVSVYVCACVCVCGVYVRACCVCVRLRMLCVCLNCRLLSTCALTNLSTSSDRPALALCLGFTSILLL